MKNIQLFLESIMADPMFLMKTNGSEQAVARVAMRTRKRDSAARVTSADVVPSGYILIYENQVRTDPMQGMVNRQDGGL